jgi:hypothetical protein
MMRRNSNYFRLQAHLVQVSTVYHILQVRTSSVKLNSGSGMQVALAVSKPAVASLKHSHLRLLAPLKWLLHSNGAEQHVRTNFAPDCLCMVQGNPLAETSTGRYEPNDHQDGDQLSIDQRLQMVLHSVLTLVLQ